MVLFLDSPETDMRHPEYDPSAVGVHNGRLFGLPFDEADSELVVIAVPWDVTVSYGSGTRQGPAAVLQASPQLDLYDGDDAGAWKRGIYYQLLDSDVLRQHDRLRGMAEQHISALESGRPQTNSYNLLEINAACGRLQEDLYRRATELIAADKLPVVLGGEHSSPLGLIRALAEQSDFGILQIDAHADLRVAYEGFEYSHASIMHNALKVKGVEKILQVGIRDICADEIEAIETAGSRVETYFMRDIKRQLFQGGNWDEVCSVIVNKLPSDVYISFDIDGLDPSLCPGTGTPVPGGLGFEEAVHLVRKLVESGRKIVGFDLCEVGPTEWDGNVAARLLYKICCLALKSRPV